MSKQNRDRELIKKRNKAIRKHFEKLSSKKTTKGRSEYSYVAMLEKLSEKFFVGETTIQRILKSDD